MSWPGWEDYKPPIRRKLVRDAAGNPAWLEIGSGKLGTPLTSEEMTQARSGSTRSKFNAQKTTVDGIVFDSKKEAQRYHELTLLAKAGRVRGLKCQVRFLLTAGVRASGVGHYIADFVYEESHLGEHWNQVVEDVKGMKTPLYRWKKKHFEAQYGIAIRET